MKGGPSRAPGRRAVRRRPPRLAPRATGSGTVWVCECGLELCGSVECASSIDTEHKSCRTSPHTLFIPTGHKTLAPDWFRLWKTLSRVALTERLRLSSCSLALPSPWFLIGDPRSLLKVALTAGVRCSEDLASPQLAYAGSVSSTIWGAEYSYLYGSTDWCGGLLYCGAEYGRPLGVLALIDARLAE